MEINPKYTDMLTYELVTIYVGNVELQELLPVKIVDTLLLNHVRHKEIPLIHDFQLTIGGVQRAIVDIDSYRLLDSEFGSRNMQISMRAAVLKVRNLLTLVNEYHEVVLQMNQRIEEERGY